MNENGLRPGDFWQERFLISYFNSPPSDRDPDEVETSSCHFSKVLLSLIEINEGLQKMSYGSSTHNESFIMILKLGNSASRTVVVSHCYTERPLIDGRRGIVGIFLI